MLAKMIRNGCLAGLLVLSAVAVAWSAESDCAIMSVTKAPYCEKCKKIIEAKEIEKSKHKGCDGKVSKRDACTKSYYECPGCKKTDKKPVMCKECKKPPVRKVSQALVSYTCPNCSKAYEKSGKCDNKDCKKKPLVKTCAQSGTPPHVGK